MGTKPEDEDEEEEEEFDQSQCEATDGVEWLGNVSRTLYQSNNGRFILINMVNKKTSFDIRENSYTGYGVLVRKYCGGDFLSALLDGRVKVELFDVVNSYEISGGFLRDDGSKSHLTFQFDAVMGNGDKGNAKKRPIVDGDHGIEYCQFWQQRRRH